MDRLLAIVALIFGFSAVVGPAVAAVQVHAPEASVVVASASDLVDLCLEPAPTTIKLFKPCPRKLTTGAAVFCHQHPGVLLAVIEPAVPERFARVTPDEGPGPTLRQAGERQFRPPRPMTAA